MANRGSDVKRILVTGGGLIGARHVRAVQAHPGAQLVGLVDPSPDIPTPAGVTRFADMAEVTVPVDGVILATPNHLHATHGIHAATRGWHMLIEKPVTDTLEDADKLAQAIDAAGVRSLVGHHRRYHDSLEQLQRMLNGGAIGTPVTATLIWAMKKPDDYFQGNWRTTHGSPVLINLIHDIDLLRALLGEVTACAALPGQRLRGALRTESGAVALQFDTGTTATISFADTTPSPWGFEAGTGENPHIGTTGQDMLFITGTRGAVSYPSLTLWGQAADWSEPAQVVQPAQDHGQPDPLTRQLSHFLEVIDGATPRIPVASARQSLAVALQIETQLAPAQETAHV